MPSKDERLLEAIGLQNQGKNDAAALLLEQILVSDPHNAAGLYSLGLVCLNRGNLALALQHAEKGCEIAPRFAPLRFLWGAALQAAGRYEEALRRYDEALEFQPDFVNVLINSGVLLRELHRHKEALERFAKVLAIEPNHVGALANSAILLTEFKQSEQAIAMFVRLLALNPDYDYGLGLLLYERLHIGDWIDFSKLVDAIDCGVRQGKRVCKSLAYMAVSDSASDHFLCTRIFAHHFCPPPKPPLWNGQVYQHDRIRVAYVSPDLREHPVGHLMAGVFEHHDQERFQIIGISLGIDDRSRLRARMLKAFDQFIDVQQMGGRQVAEFMREQEVDIAVDLAGYTSDSRIDVFSYRPAPVQATFLGFPGTLGVSYMDYLIADRHVIPPEHQPFYSESVAYLPDSYLPTDRSIQIAGRTPTRSECGLPESGPVLCSFSHDYKISPPLWAVWMRILQRIPGSVLWLACRHDAAQGNYRKQASLAGIDPERLVFAKRVPRVEDHLARYRLADLFLDTWPYNAHTTAADALMAGLPVVTRMGGAFPARVAGSLLHTLGLPELIAPDWESYEELVVRLVGDPPAVAALKRKLADNSVTSPLFDTASFTRNLEEVFTTMLREKMALVA